MRKMKSIKIKDTPFKSNGVSLSTKFAAALDPSSFGIDERSTSDLLNFVLELSKHLRYKNFNNEIDGNWSVFFENDLSFLLAKINHIHVDKLSDRFDQRLKTFNDSDGNYKKVLYSDVLNECLFLYKRINNWYKSSRSNIEHLSKNVLDPHLNSAIRLKLSPHLHLIWELQMDLISSKKSDDIKINWEEFDPIWRLNEMTAKTKSNSKSIIDFDKAVIKLSKAHRDAVGVISHLKHQAPILLEHVLENYPYHEPHVSLIISFIKLFKHVQGDINEISTRHLDYYFKGVLKQSKRKPTPDRVHIYFDLAEHVESAQIQTGTLLNSGVDEEGLDCTYATLQPLELSQAKVDQLRIIHVANNPSIGIGHSLKDVSNIYSSNVNLRDDGFILNEAGNPAITHPFGRDQSDISLIHRDMQQAEIGFAISSPVLAMKEGERGINFTLKFSLKSLTSLVSFMEEIALAEKLSADNAFDKILNNVFEIRVTTSEGWYEISTYKIIRHNAWTDGEIQIKMVLDVSDPAIINFDKEVHGTGYIAKWPLFEFIISSKYAMFSYSYLKDLNIETCRIDTEVSQVKDMIVFNDQGQLDIHMPFFPFGGSPQLGSYFLLGYAELFDREITDCSLDIQWHNLPRTKGGFEAYYKEYNEGITNNSFKVGLTGLSEFKFHPSESSSIQQFPLFRINENEKSLIPNTEFNQIDLEKLGLTPSYGPIDIDEYSSKTRTGFLKFELSAPDMGFGFDLFPKLYSETIVENSTLVSGLIKPKEVPKKNLPNQAFAPQIRSISLSYKASSTFTFAADRVADNEERVKNQFYHIHPFGKRVIFNDGLPKLSTLLPQYDDEGYLLIGLTQLNPPQTINLLFELEHNASNILNFSDLPDVKWSYLVDDEWMPFEDGDILSDGTNNFTTSGIVGLKIPELITSQHQILPSDVFWISASVSRNTQVLSKLIFIRSNAAMVQWVAHKERAEWEKNIPPGSINSLIETRSDINSIGQPFVSFGGSQGESDMSYYNRISERLRHKNRAIIPEDFERIILNRFPELYQVKCLNNSRFPNFIRPGEIIVVVVNKVNTNGAFILPRADFNQLQMIENEVQKITSPFVKLKCINPVYEKVKISCNVQFISSAATGEFLNRIQQDLQKYICPWFDEFQSEMQFGGNLERSALLSFIESLDYVKFVTRLSIVVLHFKSGEYSISDSAASDGKINTLKTSTPWSVLVPDIDHDITIIDRIVHSAAKETTIDTMKVGGDFVISEEIEEKMTYPYFDTEKDVFYSIEITL